LSTYLRGIHLNILYLLNHLIFEVPYEIDIFMPVYRVEHQVKRTLVTLHDVTQNSFSDLPIDHYITFLRYGNSTLNVYFVPGTMQCLDGICVEVYRDLS
jgi:hypothetical protein